MSDLNEEAPQYDGYQIRQYENGDQQFNEGDYQLQHDIHATAHFTQPPINTVSQINNQVANDNSFNGRSSNEVRNGSSHENGNNSRHSSGSGSQGNHQVHNINYHLIQSQNNDQINDSQTRGQAYQAHQANQVHQVRQAHQVHQAQHAQQAQQEHLNNSNHGLEKNSSQNNQKYQQPIMIQSQSQGTTTLLQNQQYQSSQGSLNQNGQTIQTVQTTLYRSQPISVTQQKPGSITRQQTFGYNNIQNRQQGQQKYQYQSQGSQQQQSQQSQPPYQQQQQPNNQTQQFQPRVNSSNSSNINALNSQVSINTTQQLSQRVQGVLSPTVANTNPNRYFSSNTSNQPSPNIRPQYQSNVTNFSQSISSIRNQTSGPITPTGQQSLRSSLNQNILVQSPNRILPLQSTTTAAPQSFMKPQSPSIPTFVANKQAAQVGQTTQLVQQPQPQVVQTGLNNQAYVSRKPTTPIITNRQGHQVLVQSPPRRQSFIVNQVSDVVVFGGGPRRVSVGKGSQQKRASVNFSYTHGAYRQLPILNPVFPQPQPQPQPQVQVIRQHTQTVIQKTTTIVWQHRYLTVIQRFNFIYDRFNYLHRQLLTITQLLEKSRGKSNLQSVYQELLAKHTLLLDMLSQTQIQLEMFKEQNSSYRKEIKYEDQLRQLTSYKQKYLQLQNQNGRIKSQYQKLLAQMTQLQKQNQTLQTNLNMTIRQFQNIQNQTQKTIQNQVQNQNQIQNQQYVELQSRFALIQQQLQKSMALNTQYQSYIHNLQVEGNNLAQQIGEFQNVERKNAQYVKIIQQKQRQILQLNSRIVDIQRNSSKLSQSIISKHLQSINQLEQKVKQLQDKSNRIQQENIDQAQKYHYLKTIQTHKLKITQLQNILNTKFHQQNERNRLLNEQQNIIMDLERKLNQLKNRPAPVTVPSNIPVNTGISVERERQLLLLVQQLQSRQKNWSFQSQKLNYQINNLRTQINSKNQQILIIREQRNSQQKVVQQQFNDRLNQLQKQLRQKLQNQIQNQNQNQKQQSPKYNRPQIDNSRQISDLLQQNQRLSSQLRKRQQEWRKLQEQFINQQQITRRKLMEKESQLRLYNDKVVMIEQELKRKIIDKDRRIKSLEQEIQTLNSRIKEVRSSIQSTPPKTIQPQQSFDSYSPSNNQQLRSLRQKLSVKEQQAYQLQRQKDNLQKKYQTLQATFNSLEEQNSRKVQQLITIKRQLSSSSTYQSEIKSLTETLNKKNQQIIELKSATFERNQLRVELEAIKNERNNLKNQTSLKTQQIDKLRITINELQTKIRQSKQKQAMYPNANQSAIEQLQIMYQSMKKKQAQMIKLKQSNQLLETNVQQLQYQLERLKGKLAAMEKNLVHQKDDGNNRMRQYQSRIKQMELKSKLLQESQRNSRTNYDAQILNLDNLVKQKQEAIRKLEGQNKILKNKLKNHDSKVQQYDGQIQTLNAKIKQLQLNRQEQKKHIDTLENGGQNNNKRLYDQYQIKIVELEAALKVKDNKIKQLQNNVQTMKIKASHNNQTEDDFINQQQIQVLRKKIAEYQLRLSNQGTSKFNNYKFRDYQSTQVFEQKALYDLKNQNERLKSLLSGKGLRYEAVDQNSKVNLDFVQKRLLDFNQKLQELIQQNRNLQQRNTDYSIYFQNKRPNQQLLNSFQRERTAIFRRHRTQISALQARMVDLQRYCSSLQSFQNTSIYNSTTSKYTLNENVKNIYSQQLNYYKQKNKELEERIDNHLKINKQLKDKLQAMLKGIGDPNAIQYYKSQISQLQRQIGDYLAKIKALTQQNKTLQINLTELRNDNSVQTRNQELQSRIHELNRKIAQLQMQNGLLDNDLAKYIQDLKNANDELNRHKIGGQEKDQKLTSTEQSIRQANTKISNYEIQVVKLTNQIKLLQAEMQRLNQKLKSKNDDENSEITRLKGRLSQLQADHRALHDHSQSWNDSKNTYEVTISTLNGRIVNLQLEIGKLNNLYQSLIKKARETENQFFSTENALKIQKNKNAELQAFLKGKQSEIQDMNSFLQRLKKQRESQGAQSKQRLAYIAQMEQTIRSLRFEITFNKNQIQRLQSEINEYRQKVSGMGNLEDVLKQLRLQTQLSKAQIQRLNGQISQYKQRIASNSQSSSQLEKVIQDLRVEISGYKNTIERLKYDNEQLRQMCSSNNRLQTVIEELRLQISKYKTEVQRYRSEFQRSKSEIQKYKNQAEGYKIQIQNLMGQISRMQRQKQQQGGQFNQSQSYIAELQQTIRKLKLQIQSYKAENYKSLSQIERLRSQIARLQIQINRLKVQINSIQQQMHLNQQIIEKIAYRLEFMRSSFIQIQALQGQIMFNQSNSRQVDLKQKLRQSVSNGLTICGETFALL